MATKNNVSKRTERYRNQFLKNQLDLAAGSQDAKIALTSKLVTSFNQNEKEIILKNADVTSPKITAEEMVAIKIDTGIPWEKLKKLSRYTKMIYQ